MCGRNVEEFGAAGQTSPKLLPTELSGASWWEFGKPGCLKKETRTAATQLMKIRTLLRLGRESIQVTFWQRIQLHSSRVFRMWGRLNA